MSEALAAPETGAEQPVSIPDPLAPEAAPVEAEAQAAETPAETPPVENKAKERLSLRFSELTAQREAAKQEAERAKQEADYWRQQASMRQEVEYGHYDEGQPLDQRSVEAMVNAAIQRDREQRARETEMRTKSERMETLRETLLESGLDGAALIASGADIPFSEAMLDALAVSEQPAVIADHLGRNPVEAARIAKMTPAQQGAELARLEARLAAQPKVTNAMAPPPTVGVRASASLDPNGMSFEQYKAAREAGKI
jgi:hypothetical protein